MTGLTIALHGCADDSDGTTWPPQAPAAVQVRPPVDGPSPRWTVASLLRGGGSRPWQPARGLRIIRILSESCPGRRERPARGPRAGPGPAGSGRLTHGPEPARGYIRVCIRIPVRYPSLCPYLHLPPLSACVCVYVCVCV